MDKIFNWIYRKLSKNGSKVPLLSFTIDINKYHKCVEGSAMCHFHPDFADDEELKQMSFEIIDYIRTHYDMDKLITTDKNERK